MMKLSGTKILVFVDHIYEDLELLYSRRPEDLLFFCRAIIDFLKRRSCALLLFGAILFYGGTAPAGAADQKVPILLYHHLQDVPPKASPLLRAWSISPKKLESQVQWLMAHGFHTITMAQLVAHLKHHQALPEKPIVLTFDDGWRDHYEIAFPMLKKYRCVATFFIITDSVGHSAYMNWDQIRRMSESGMDMEAHTVTHPKLTRIPPQDAYREIEQSKKVLEDHLHRPVTIFAYPFGAYDDRVIGQVREAGYEAAAAVSGMNGSYLYRADESYTLFRKVVMNYEALDHFAGVSR